MHRWITKSNESNETKSNQTKPNEEIQRTQIESNQTNLKHANFIQTSQRIYFKKGKRSVTQPQQTDLLGFINKMNGTVKTKDINKSTNQSRTRITSNI